MTKTMACALPRLVVFIVFLSFIEAFLPPQYLDNSRRIPEIKEGEKCVKGQIYKMDCNTCHCGVGSSLVCTKMACLDPQDLNRMRNGSLRTNVTGTKKACTPGKFYKKGCQKCFCTDRKGLKCSVTNDCKLVDKPYTNPDRIHSYSPEEFYRLPALPHQGAECQAGVTYRIDCNTCFCLSNGNLMCQKLLCPSYNDVYRLKAQEMSGKPCVGNASITEDCLQCRCVVNKYACEPKPICNHSDGRRMMHGEYPSEHDRNFIDLDKPTDECVPGMVYKVHCNKCYCQDDGSLRCTQKTCLNFEEVQRLKKLRLKLESEEREDGTAGN